MKFNKLAATLALCSSAALMPNAHAAGYIDVATTAFRFAGWACDPSIPNFSGWVHFYRDDDKFLGALLANIPRESGVAAACNDSGVHGFDGSLSIPAEYLDNKDHAVRAYFIRPDNSNFLLGNVKTVRFAPPPPPMVSGCDVPYPGTGWVLTASDPDAMGCTPAQTHYTYTYIAGLGIGTEMSICYTPRPIPVGWVSYGSGGPAGSQCYYTNSMGFKVPDTFRLIRRNY